MGRVLLSGRLGAGRFGKAAHRLGLVVVNIKDGVELGDLQEVVDLLGQVQEFQLAALVRDGRISVDKLADSRAVDIGYVSQVQQDILIALRQLFAHQITQLRTSFSQRDPAADVDDGDGINLTYCRLHAHGPFLLDKTSLWNSIASPGSPPSRNPPCSARETHP